MAEMPIPVDESLTPCPARHPLFGLCVGPVNHLGVHAMWNGDHWWTWTDEQCLRVA